MTGVARARKLSAIREYFRFLEGVGFIQKSRTTGIDTPKREKNTRQYFRPDEYTKMLSLAGANPRDYAILQVFLQTGIRVSELTNLTIDAVDLLKPCIKVVGKGKGCRTECCVATGSSEVCRQKLARVLCPQASKTVIARKKRPLPARDAPVMLRRTSGPRRKNPSSFNPACRLVQPSRMLLYCPFLWRRSVYSIGIFLKVMPSMVAQTMVRQLISVVNTSIWSVRWRTRLHRLSIALVVLM